MMMTTGPPQTFRIPEALALYHVPPASYIAQVQPHLDRLVAGAIVTHAGRILLIQRSRHDYGGLCWEVPGGMCEASDRSIVGAACRELYEEAGLRAAAVLGLVDTHHHSSTDGLTWWKFTFLVDVEPVPGSGGGGGAAAVGVGGNPGFGHGAAPVMGRQQPVVKLDPDEHEDFVWATEEDVRLGRCGDRIFTWINDVQRQTVLKAFRMLRAEVEGPQN
jgi:8-oxo-dGTP pyrophosphatase MutT (NUDIX family)